MGKNIESIKGLTEELFLYSIIVDHSEALIKEDVSINNVLEESIAIYYPELSKHKIVPDIHITPTKVIRKVDSAALSRIFSNLINNAIKYSDGDLEITLSEDGNIVFSNSAKELSNVEIGKLFNRFFTVESARKSTGLGLSIVKTLTEEMDGTISAGFSDGKLRICISFN